MNCINCGEPIPEGEGSLGFKYEPLSDVEIAQVNLPPLKLGLEPLQLGFECPSCKRNSIAIKDLMKRGALDGDDYITMLQERTIVEHLKAMEKNWLKQAAIEIKADADSGFAYDLFMMYCGSQIIQEKECKYSFAWLDFKDPEKRKKLLEKYNIEF